MRLVKLGFFSDAMKQLTIFSLIGIWLCLLGCGDEETPLSTVVKDTTHPAIVGTNVQGGPIPVNTPIVLVFNEKVNLISARHGISVLSSIDAEPVIGSPNLFGAFFPTNRDVRESSLERFRKRFNH